MSTVLEKLNESTQVAGIAQVKTAEAAVSVAANEAILASLQGTFAVGGAMIENASGRVIVALHNNVLKPCKEGKTYFLPFDPTAHGERQLVDWYFANRVALKLPAPEQLTIVTSLDPCAMCAGALLTAGFNVAVSAIDTYAGVNYNQKFDFPSFPPVVRQKAQASFGYYAVEAPINRTYQGSQRPVFAGQKLTTATNVLTGSVFDASVGNVRANSNNSGLDPSQMRNPASLSADAPVRKALMQACSLAFSVTCANPRDPGKELAAPLLTTAQNAARNGGSYNAVALLDPFGNLLMCMGGYERTSPIRTAFMETTRTYANLRWTLMNDPNPAVRDQARDTLTHPKYGTFVFLYVPDPASAIAVMTFGAYGSTMEGPIPQAYPSNLQYVLLPPGVTSQAVANLAMHMPPFYTQSVQIAPMQVLSAELIQACSKGATPKVEQ